MSFSSLLATITKNKALTKNDQTTRISSNVPSRTVGNNSTLRTSPDVDPAVARLKEARRLEKEKRQSLKDSKKPKTSTVSKSGPRPKATTYPSSSFLKQSTAPSKRGKSTSLPPLPPPKPASNGPKLSFKELMKQAENVDKKNLVYEPIKTSSEKSKTKPTSKLLNKPDQSTTTISRHSSTSPLPPPTSKLSVMGSRPIPTSRQIPKSSQHQQKQKGPTGSSNQSHEATRPSSQQQQPSRPRTAPPTKPALAQPSVELMNKLSKKKEQGQTKKPMKSSYPSRPKPAKDNFGIDANDSEGSGLSDYYEDYDDDDDDDGFVVYDEEDELAELERQRARRRQQQQRAKTRDQGYDRDEIWSIFSKGRKRSHYDEFDDDDDMEATGAEILEEEEATLKQARLDDLKEQRILEQRQLEKQKRLKK